jgi:hypothetical protein
MLPVPPDALVFVVITETVVAPPAPERVATVTVA